MNTIKTNPNRQKLLHQLSTRDWSFPGETGDVVLAKGHIVDEITNLKKQAGKDIIAYGEVSFVSDLIKHGLSDELYLFINPVAHGTGMTIYNNLENKQNFKLETSKAFSCGIALIKYRKAAEPINPTAGQ